MQDEMFCMNEIILLFAWCLYFPHMKLLEYLNICWIRMTDLKATKSRFYSRQLSIYLQNWPFLGIRNYYHLRKTASSEGVDYGWEFQLMLDKFLLKSFDLLKVFWRFHIFETGNSRKFSCHRHSQPWMVSVSFE